MILPLVVALPIFAVALDGGGYSPVSRHSLAIAVWWAVLVGALLGVWPRARVERPAFAAAALLLAYALLAGLSILWADSAERAFLELVRAALYAGVFVLAVLASTRATMRAWSDGIAIGITASAAVALLSRLFPRLFDVPDVPTLLPAAATRLSYPLNYWNGLAIFVALALPLLLRAAISAESPFARALALAPVPLLAAVIYLTSSRGGVAAAAIGAAGFVALAGRRWAAVAATLVAACAAGGSIAVLAAHPAVVDAPASDAAAAEARSVAVLLLLACVVTAAAWFLASFLPTPARIPAWVGWSATAAAVVVAVAAVAAADPAARVRAFAAPPPETPPTKEGFVREHLLSAGGSGRWQFWDAAYRQFAEQPLLGHGAGSYEAWWAQHGTLPVFVRDAHSLYVETLGELGLVGLLLLVGAMGAAAAAPVRSWRLLDAEERTAVAGVAAAFVAYAVGAGIDWMWELTIVSVVGFALLGLLAGPASAAVDRPSTRFPAGAAALVAWIAMCAAAVPLLSHLKLSDSRAAAARGQFAEALDAAIAARAIQPWAATPYVQLALVDEELGALRRARLRLTQAKERDATDWRIWVVSARIETKLGEVERARADLAEARSLNPRSPLLGNR